MTLVKFLKIEFINTAAERFGALMMLQATWREPKLDSMVMHRFLFLPLPTCIEF